MTKTAKVTYVQFFVNKDTVNRHRLALTIYIYIYIYIYIVLVGFLMILNVLLYLCSLRKEFVFLNILTHCYFIRFFIRCWYFIYLFYRCFTRFDHCCSFKLLATIRKKITEKKANKDKKIKRRKRSLFTVLGRRKPLIGRENSQKAKLENFEVEVSSLTQLV